jgi:hypothetical protein
MQNITVINQPITGSATNFLTAAVNVPSGFTSAQYTFSISNPANGNAQFSAVIEGSNDGVTWFDMFGIGSQNGTTASGGGQVGGTSLPALVRAKASWNNSFTISVSITLLP